LASDVATVLRTAIEGSKVGLYRKDGVDNDIILQYEGEQVKLPRQIGDIMVQNQLGKQIEIGSVSKIVETTGQQDLHRNKRNKLVMISANLQGSKLGEVTGKIDEKLSRTPIPEGYKIEYGGDQKNTNESFGELSMVLVLSLFLVYMILAILYESFLTPFIRMLSLPVGIVGALLGLLLVGGTLNINSLIGVIMLDALVAKNGTLLVDYTNALTKKGLVLKEALLTAGRTRITPILMTSSTMIVGMLPTAIAFGNGAEVKRDMAVVLIGGLISSTILSPIIIPIAYTFFEEIIERVKGKIRRDA